MAEHLWVVGPGRVGLALGLLLQRAGALASLQVAGRAAAAPAHPLFDGPAPARYVTGLRFAAAPAPTGVLVAVPDDAVTRVAAALAARGVPAGTPVLHLAGVLGADALEPLQACGCPTGALHPLAAVADAVGGAERLRAVWWGLEAEGAARALAERVVRAAEGRVLPLQPGGKPLYHAAAVLASNYVVALLAAAERLIAEAGAPPEAREALLELAHGALANVAARGPARGLSGPIARGDAETVRRHLARLSGRERRLYSLLGREAVALAAEAGLEPAAVRRLQHLLMEEA